MVDLIFTFIFDSLSYFFQDSAFFLPFIGLVFVVFLLRLPFMIFGGFKND